MRRPCKEGETVVITKNFGGNLIPMTAGKVVLKPCKLSISARASWIVDNLVFTRHTRDRKRGSDRLTDVVNPQTER